MCLVRLGGGSHLPIRVKLDGWAREAREASFSSNVSTKSVIELVKSFSIIIGVEVLVIVCICLAIASLVGAWVRQMVV